MLFDLPSVKSPINYFGGKTRAVKILSHFMPQSVQEVVSPFLGGGSFELHLTGRGIRVYGSDAFPPLINFWQQLLESPQALCNVIRQTLLNYRDQQWCRSATADKFRLQESSDPLINAAHWLILNNLSFRNKGSRRSALLELKISDDGKATTLDGSEGSSLILYDRIYEFQNSLMHVKCLDFTEAFANQPADMFAYCDPPYPEADCEYGSSRAFGQDFDHEGLARILRGRENWMLSYNDVELVRDLYPDSRYKWAHVQWSQSAIRHNYEGNDVVITPYYQQRRFEIHEKRYLRNMRIPARRCHSNRVQG